jgi:release factor glutamine methyltransferase
LLKNAPPNSPRRMTDDGTITWRELLALATKQMGDANEARWLCEEVCGDRGAAFQATLDTAATQRAVARFDALLARRLTGEPLQYVLGSWSFRTLELMVDTRVLIPRPETEVVAGAAIDSARKIDGVARVVDLGTGSGAIALSMVAELPLASVEVWGTDLSHDALDVARANLAGLGRRGTAVRLVQGSWFEALPNELQGAVHVVVSNPPYIATGDPDLASSVTEWEPHVALFADNDGLAAYETIINDASDWLTDDGWLVLEIGYRQAAAVAELCASAGFVDVETHQDLAGLDRVVVARRPPR